jgi:YD repeat-containing protein
VRRVWPPPHTGLCRLALVRKARREHAGERFCHPPHPRTPALAATTPPTATRTLTVTKTFTITRTPTKTPTSTCTVTNTPTITNTPTATLTPGSITPVTSHLHYTYDPAGRLSQLTDPQPATGTPVSESVSTYDAAGRVSKLVQPGGGTFTVKWNGADQLTEVDAPNGGKQTWSYDPTGASRRGATTRRGR